MTALRKLVAFLESSDPVAVGSAPGEGLPRALELAAAHDPDVHALVRAVVDRGTSYCFGELEIFPAVLTRRPRKDGVATDTEICLGKNGAGDLYLWDATTGATRLVVHDDDWVTRRRWSGVAAMIEDVLHASLEAIEADEIEELAGQPPEVLARLRLALEIAPDALQDETREALESAGVI